MALHTLTKRMEAVIDPSRMYVKEDSVGLSEKIEMFKGNENSKCQNRIAADQGYFISGNSSLHSSSLTPVRRTE